MDASCLINWAFQSNSSSWPKASCRRVFQLGATLNSHCYFFSLIFRIRPCKACFIILLVLDLIIGPSIPCKESLDGLVAPLSFSPSLKGFVLESNLLPTPKEDRSATLKVALMLPYFLGPACKHCHLSFLELEKVYLLLVAAWIFFEQEIFLSSHEHRSNLLFTKVCN